MSGGAVELVCLGDTAYLADLGLNMVRGSTATVTLETASRSRDLQDAKARGIVGVKIMKAQVVRSGNAPSENHRSIARAALPAAPPPAEVPSTDTAQIVQAIRSLQGDIQKLRSSLGDTIGEAVSEAVAKALRGISFQGGASPTHSSAAPVSGPDVPMFIPTGIVDKSTTAEIATTTSVTSGVEDSEAALRALRKQKAEKSNG